MFCLAALRSICATVSEGICPISRQWSYIVLPAARLRPAYRRTSPSTTSAESCILAERAAAAAPTPKTHIFENCSGMVHQLAVQARALQLTRKYFACHLCVSSPDGSLNRSVVWLRRVGAFVEALRSKRGVKRSRAVQTAAIDTRGHKTLGISLCGTSLPRVCGPRATARSKLTLRQLRLAQLSLQGPPPAIDATDVKSIADAGWATGRQAVGSLATHQKPE